jgi:3'-phosphoadenosine 5'-phosphosulfate sulfotransferase (PAPS reductase)/FAD synthetase
MKQKHYASVSFGKDSLAMLLLLIEMGYPLDEVVFFNTGMEFKAIYEMRDRVLPLLSKRGIAYTELKPATPFLEKMLNTPMRRRDGSCSIGYSWCGGARRWGTGEKLKAVRKHVGNGYSYVGIAADEVERIARGKHARKILPLVDWGVTEAQALQLCYGRGFDWVENGVRLYDVLDRVSCWCCANKNNRELLGMYRHLPEYWERLKELEQKNRLDFRQGCSIFDIESSIKSGTLTFRKCKGVNVFSKTPTP